MSCMIRFVLSVSVSLVSFAAANAQESPVARIAIRARAELQSAVNQDAWLHGTWVDVVRLEDDSVRVDAIVDADPRLGDVQERLIRALAARSLPATTYVLNFTRLPFRALFAELRETVELHPALPGVAIDDAYFVPGTGDALLIHVVGRVSDPKQRTTVWRMLDVMLPRFFGSRFTRIHSPAVEPEFSTTGLVVLEPSEQAAARCYDRGVNAYLQHDYATAYWYFTRGHVDSPMREDMQYWRVASLIGAGREGKATVLLTELVRPSGRTPGLLSRLEKVQGPIRQRLVAIETYLQANIETTVDAKALSYPAEWRSAYRPE